MAYKTLVINSFYGGIAPSEKQGATGSFFFNKGLNILDEPSHVTLLPEAVKDSGSTVVGLVKWIVPATPYDTNIYFYDDGGNIYSRSSGGTWTKLRTVASSVGQGMDLYGDYIYYTQNTQIGRYGTLSGGSPSFTDNWQTSLNDTSTTGFAPVKAFKEGLAVGNGNDLGWYDGSTWDQDRVILPPGFNIRSLTVLDEFLVIGAWKGTAITDSSQGYLFFWDGSAVTFNFFVEVQEGGVAATLNSRNRLLSSFGSSGYFYLNYAPSLLKIDRVPKIEYGKYVDIFPGAMTNWKGASFIGVGGNTDSTAIEQGVYQYGSIQNEYPETLSFAYPISTGSTTGTTVKIGAIEGVGSALYIGWRDGSSYGVDRVIQTADPYASGFYESLIFDDGRTGAQKQAIKIKATHKALASGESIQLGYQTDRSGSYTLGTANSTVGSTTTILNVDADDARFYEFQMKAILAATGSTSPTLTSLTLVYDPLDNEDIV